MADAVGEKDICLKCGKCCKLIQSLKSYDELCKMAEDDDKTAVNFLKLFLPHDNLESALKIDRTAVERIIEINKLKYGPQTQTYFYYCRYLNTDNTCKVYKMRPKLCREFPKTAFTIVPENCAYEGYIFEEQEKIKKQIRKIKEELMEISQIKSASNDESYIQKLELLEKKYQMVIEKYRFYGSKDW